jgi:hypothetical protein
MLLQLLIPAFNVHLSSLTPFERLGPQQEKATFPPNLLDPRTAAQTAEA